MTAFTNTWNNTYIGLPQDTENASLGASRIRDFKNDTTQRQQVDHSWAGDANDGTHNKVTLRPQGADPTVSAGGDNTANYVYTKQVSGITELFCKDAAGNVYQITSNGSVGATGDVYASLANSRAGCVLMDGSSYIRTGIYAALFALLGTTFGSVDGTHFNVPDFRGKTIIGAGTGARILTGATNTVTAATPGSISITKHGLSNGQPLVYTSAGPIGGLTSGVTYYVGVKDANNIYLADTLAHAQAGTYLAFSNQGTQNWTLTYNLTARSIGDELGEEIHGLALTELTPHTHTINDTGHAHGSAAANSGSQTLTPGGVPAAAAGSSTATATTGITINNAGSSNSHNNMQPSVVVNYFIHL